MAVPTIYVKLIDYLNSLDAETAKAVCDGFAAMRLNVSGSAACPVTVFNEWQALTGQVLLERYGMTEIGMGFRIPMTVSDAPATSVRLCPAYRFDCSTKTIRPSMGQIRRERFASKAITSSTSTGITKGNAGELQGR